MSGLASRTSASHLSGRNRDGTRPLTLPTPPKRRGACCRRLQLPKSSFVAPSEHLGERPPRTDSGVVRRQSLYLNAVPTRDFPGSDLVRDEHILAGELLELRSRSLPKLVASTSGGLPPIHSDRSMSS